MDSLLIEQTFSEGIKVRLALLSYIDENVHVVYSPALDLYGYGNDEVEAQNSFSITIEEYIRYTHDENTLRDDLTRIGWQIDERQHELQPPSWTQLLESNPYLNDVMTNRPFKKYDKTVNVPAFT